MTQHPLADALRTARNRLQRLALELPHASRARADAFDWAEEATDALAQHEKSDTDRDQLRDELLALPESAVSLGVEGQAPYSCYEITEDQRTRLLAALASKTAIDPVTERCAQVAEGYFKGHFSTFGTTRAYAHEHAGRRIASAIRALGKDQ